MEVIMADTLESLTKRVRALPVTDQLVLAEEILERAATSELHPSWDTELERRIAEVERGGQTYDADEVMSDIRARLKEPRALK
jgi:putative addiction module component (TIGR02574 family)